MSPAIVPFLHRWKHKPGLYPDPVYRLTIRSHLPFSGSIEIYQAVVRTHLCPASGSTNPDGIGLLTISRSPVTAPMTYDHLFHLLGRFVEMPVHRQKTSDLKEYRSRSSHPYQTRTSFPVGIPYPNADHILGIHSHRPSIPETKTSSRFPGQIHRRDKIFPPRFHFRPFHLLQSLHGLPDRRSFQYTPIRTNFFLFLILSFRSAILLPNLQTGIFPVKILSVPVIIMIQYSTHSSIQITNIPK